MPDAVSVERLVKNYYTYIRRGILGREKKVIEALKGISFKVSYGEVFGLLGPNGAGKTTTVKILSTLLIPEDGEAHVAGYNVVSEPEKVRMNIGVTLSVEKGFFWKLTGRENLMYFGMLKGLRGSELRDRVEYLLDKLGLNRLEASDKLYEEYSLGMRARLSLSRALLIDPPILILDEPTLGLDPPSARTIRSLLVNLAREEGKAVLVTTHNMFEAELICDRVAIINDGIIAGMGTVQELKSIVSENISVEILLAGIEGEDKLNDMICGLMGEGKAMVSTTLEGRYRLKLVCKPSAEEDIVADVIRKLDRLGGKVYRVDIVEPSLEDVFITLTRSRGDTI